ncbi:capsular biosynthesis protein [Erythrobacter sp. SG61-1L]|uniref:capsular biosynthesis protein n=1 Tax=Erythrobacter sp. SG61-1L TaxID=1603897 RepID=UPI0006C90F8F|nr:capsular biosynthesis protein [Erythrobacter sp. SG61-1L]KPL67484.1 capsular biosynthesis protein [Erythrobacter sp. SG61-1L]
MTEQSKIPVPPEGEGEKGGNSLFERANGAFDLGGAFKPAPMPKDLAQIPSRIKRPAMAPAPQPKAVPAPVETPVAAPVAQPVAPAPQPVAAAEPVMSAPAAVQAAPVQPIHFQSARHPVDRARLREQGLIEPEGAVSTLLEEFRIVKRELLQSAREAQAKGAGAMAQRVLVCSPLPGEGKTFCSTNLALAMAAEKDSEVLLVDADFAKPSVLSVLGLPGGPGLMDALADPSIRVEDCVIGTDIPGLWVLPAGNQTTRDSEYLASGRTVQVLDRLTQGVPGRMVIFDSPPALAASPAADLAKLVGQTLLVVRADATGQNAIEDALHLLSNCADIKLLLNDANFSPSGRRFGSYYGYGG